MIRAMGPVRSRRLMISTVLALLVLTPATAISGAAGFVLLAYLPGRLLLSTFGLERFGGQAGRLLFSVSLSWAVMPFLLNPVWYKTNNGLVLLGFTWAAMVCLAWIKGGTDEATLEPDDVRPLFESAAARLSAGLVAAIVVPSVILPFWPTELLGYPIPSQIHDFIKHHAVMDSLERRSLPLGNVFYAAGSAEPVYYYHFFYLIPATVRQWAGPGLEIELAFGIASALAALATAGMVYALAKRFGGGEGTAILATLLVTLIGALDIIPLIPHMVKVGHPVVVQDAWAMHEFRIHNFINQMIWAPQNVTGVLIVLLAVFLVSRRPSWRGWLLWGPIFASSVIGSSVWVAIGAFAGLAAWAGTARRFLVGTILVGALTLAMSWPMLWGYADSAGRQGGGLTGVFPRNDYAVFGWLAPPGPVANLLDFPMWLVLEFGARVLFLPLLAGAVWRRLWQDQGMRWLGFSSVMSLIAFNLVHSNLSYNAFGQRIILLPMVLTSILAGCVLAPGAGTVRWWNVGGCVWSGRIRSAAVKGLAAVVLLAGLPVGFWEAPLGTFRRYGEELARRRALPPDEQRDFDAEREAWAFMRRALPADAVVQPDPGPERATLAQIARRQLGVIGPQDDVLVFDPPDRTSYLRCVDRVSSVLRQGESAGETHRVLHRFHVTHVFIGIVERRSWSHMDRFDDQSYFEDAFRRGPVRVLRLR